MTGELTDATAQGWVYGTDLDVRARRRRRRGAGRTPVPQPQHVPEWTGDYAVAPLPLVSDVFLGLASCDQYPDGNGSPEVAPGTYDLVAQPWSAA